MKLMIILSTLVTITGCTMNINGNDYNDVEPKLNMQEFFDGEIEVWGIIQERNGHVIRKFKAHIDASWEDDKGILDESFVFDDGEKQVRVWHLEKVSEDEFTGTAADVVGQAKGKIYGNALQWEYDLLIPYKGSEMKVRLDDWMWLFDDETLMNRSYMKKFGFKVAEITIFMKKKSPTQE